MSRWYPLRTSSQHRPEQGQLIAHEHAVWRVNDIADIPLSETDRELWLKRGMPDLATWGERPYKLAVEWVGGAAPPWAKDGDQRKLGEIEVPAGAFTDWHVYRGDRWPQCSCCGEPMPCRAELEDAEVNRSLERLARLEAIPVGACWDCVEPITRRQKWVTYPGENLDLPGGQQPYFHTRGKCRPTAERYEKKWISADPRRERILTWPHCGGMLIVHADGSSECVAGRDLIGQDHEPQPGCGGHLTHDHGVHKACFVKDFTSNPRVHQVACPRGCDPKNHRGTWTTPRPERRQPSVGHLFSDAKREMGL